MSSEKLLDVARHLIRAGAGQDMYRTLVTRMRRALGRGHSVSFFLVYRASDLVLPVAESAESGLRVHPEAYTQKITAGIIGEVVKTGRTYYAHDVEKDRLFVSGGQTGGSELVVPVRFEDEVVGVLNIETPRKDAFSPDLVARIELVCEAAGILMNSGIAQEQQQAMEAQIKGLERGIAIARARFELLAGSLQDAVLTLDADGKVLWENGAWGGAFAALPGRDFDLALSPASAAAWERGAPKVRPITLEVRVGKRLERATARVMSLPVGEGDGGKLLVLTRAKAAKKRRP
jgi:GAF domain-containing protein